MNANTLTRRTLLRQTLGAGLGSLGALTAQAQTASDYKALVCIFLMGGNDGHNMVVPLSPAAFNAYKAARPGLALPDNSATLLSVAARNGVPYGLNSGLSALHPLWAQQKLAVVANMGMLVRPTTRAQYLAASVNLPSNLFSHSDQIVQMQAGDPIGAAGGTGWAGRIADASLARNSGTTFPPSISVAGSALFCAGKTVQSASLLPGFDLTPDGMAAWPASAAAAKAKALQEILALDSGLAMVQTANRVRQDASALNGLLKAAGSGGGLGTAFPGTGLGQQLKQVAQIIKLRASTGVGRQVFFCSLGGFDTHSGQSWQQWDLLRQLSEAILAFYNATGEMGVANQVTTFTASEFGRSLQPSGTGTDHGWGNHQLLVGGAVRGGDLYGTFPTPALGGADDAGSRGVLIPTTALDQFGATLARWFGLSPAALLTVFPNLGNFATSDLGFMS
ncbi:MAG: DUF1501 domain-containing protein [Burkholderiaceae bacterium]|nr:DUF1501 domain-containing protein [Burkholderiaceae bacterium]